MDRIKSIYRERPNTSRFGTLVVAGIVVYVAQRVILRGRDSALTESQSKVSEAKGVERVCCRGDEVSSAATTLAKAYKATKLAKNIVPDGSSDEELESRMKTYFTTMLKAATPTSFGMLVLRSTDSSSVAVWSPPGVSYPTGAVASLNGFRRPTGVTGFWRRKRLEIIDEVISAHRERIMGSERNYYELHYAGCSAGSTSSVIAPVVAQAKAAGKRAFAAVCLSETAEALSEAGFSVDSSCVMYDTAIKFMVL